MDNISIYTKSGYILSKNEQRAAVLMAHGFSLDTIARACEVTIAEAEIICRAAKIKMERSFKGDAFAHLRMINVGALFCIFLTVLILFQDCDANRGRKMKERVRRKEDAAWIV